MLALAAAVVFFLALLKVTLGSISLLYLGLFLIAMHLWLGGLDAVRKALTRLGERLQVANHCVLDQVRCLKTRSVASRSGPAPHRPTGRTVLVPCLTNVQPQAERAAR